MQKRWKELKNSLRNNIIYIFYRRRHSCWAVCSQTKKKAKNSRLGTSTLTQSSQLRFTDLMEIRHNIYWSRILLDIISASLFSWKFPRLLTGRTSKCGWTHREIVCLRHHVECRSSSGAYSKEADARIPVQAPLRIGHAKTQQRIRGDHVWFLRWWQW